MTVVLFLKNLVFTILVPGSVALYVPYRLLASGGHSSLRDTGPFRLVGIVLVLAGGLLYFWCILNFAAVGRGTPAPIDPPKSLVVRGPYRFCRNPMYVAVIAVIFGLSWVFVSRRLLLYGLVIWAAFHLFVVLYEEPTLRRSFGPGFERYCATVPRWRPRRPVATRAG